LSTAPHTKRELDSGRLVPNRQDYSRFSYSVPRLPPIDTAFGGPLDREVGRARLVGPARPM